MALPMSCISPPRFAIFWSMPISAAIMPARCATSIEWLQDVLAVRGAVVEPAEQVLELGVDAVHADLEAGHLAQLADLVLDLGLHLGDHLLDARRMDAPVGDQALEREARDLAAHRIEARQDHRLGRVVDDDVDAGEGLERADVAPLAADDAALHVVARQVHHRDGRLGDVIAGVALDREQR